MIACARVTKREIRLHYDLATPFYRLLWGPHIHHGVWDADAPPLQAQQQLIDRLAAAASVAAGEDVLDVGCGMGGSSIELARRYGCRVTGLTLSPVQRAWARMSAAWQGTAGRTRFLCGDAERVAFQAASFDVVWNVECSEHFFDKPAFFRRAADWLRPGGRVALCAWLAGDGPDPDGLAAAVCENFLCPSLGTADDYRGWLTDAGLRVRSFDDLTTARFAHLGDSSRPGSPQSRRLARPAGRPSDDALPRPLLDAAERIPHRRDALRNLRRGETDVLTRISGWITGQRRSGRRLA